LPDRCKQLPEQLLPSLKAIQPDLIFHAGDVVTPKVIDLFEEVAPVVMVRGNRDVYLFPYVPRKKELYINGVMITLLHGHARVIHYLINKVRYVLFRFRLEWFLPKILLEGEGADVIIFGHTHRQMNEVRNGQLLFNPGSVTISPEKGVPLSYGVLKISGAGEVASEIVEID
jgi:putative phosphoesterase